MQYLLLIYDNEKLWDTMTAEKAGAMMGEYMAFTKSIRESGHYVGGNALQPTATATTVRVKEGKPFTTDGPFAETREQLGGYYLVNARDLDEARSIAARIPSAAHGIGCIEIRPIREM